MEINHYSTKQEIADAIKLGKEVYYTNVSTIVVQTDEGLQADYGNGCLVKIYEDDYDRCFSTGGTYYLNCENTFRDNLGEIITTKKVYAYGNKKSAMCKFGEIEQTFFNRGPFSYWSWGATIDKDRFLSTRDGLPFYNITQGDNVFKMSISWHDVLPIRK